MKHIALVCALAFCVLAADALSLRGLAEGRWTHPPEPRRIPPQEYFLASLRGAAHAAQTPAATARSGAGVPADTLRYRIAVGETFVTALPDTLDGRPVLAYAIEQAPTFSWLQGYSFFWRPRPQDGGVHRLQFRAGLQDAPADTLVMVVTVE